MKEGRNRREVAGRRKKHFLTRAPGECGQRRRGRAQEAAAGTRVGALPGDREAPRCASRERHAGQGSAGAQGGGTEGSAGGERGGREGDWVKRREAGAEGRTEAPAPLLEKSPQIPRARGNRLDVTASRLGARPPSRASPRHRRHIAPPTPAPLPLGFDPAPQSHPGRLGPLRTSHTAHRRQPPSSRARAPAPPPNAAST